MDEESQVRGCYNITFNTLDNWAIKSPRQSKRKRTGKKRLKGMARNMYTIHSVT